MPIRDSCHFVASCIVRTLSCTVPTLLSRRAFPPIYHGSVLHGGSAFLTPLSRPYSIQYSSQKSNLSALQYTQGYQLCEWYISWVLLLVIPSADGNFLHITKIYTMRYVYGCKFWYPYVSILAKIRVLSHSRNYTVSYCLGAFTIIILKTDRPVLVKIT